MIQWQNSRFERIELIGEGGQALVYRAWDPSLQRDVAIKVLRDGSSRQLLREARTAAGLRHAGLVQVYEIDESAKPPFVVMEFVNGRSLREALRNGPLPTGRAIDYAVQAADAMRVAHEAGVVHRDLSPANILTRSDGRICIVDLGLASSGDALSPCDEQTISEDLSRVVGTLAYLAPEVIAGQPATPQSDIFSLGTVLYEMLTGKKAFSGPTKAASLARTLHGDHPGFAQIPEAVRPALERALAADPNARWRSMADFAFALRTSGLPAGRPLNGPTRRGASVLLGGGLAAVAGAIGYGIAKRPENPAQPIVVSRVTQVRGDIEVAQFSPTGNEVYFSLRSPGRKGYYLHVMRLDDYAPRPIALPSTPRFVISRTSQIAFLETTSPFPPATMGISGLEGGNVWGRIPDVHSATWSADGTQLAIIRNVNGRARLEYPPGRLRSERDDSSSAFVSFCFDPTGARFAFLQWDKQRFSLVTGDARAEEFRYTPLTDDVAEPTGLCWSADGQSLFLGDNHPKFGHCVRRFWLSGKNDLVYTSADLVYVCDHRRDKGLLAIIQRGRFASFTTGPGWEGERDLGWLRGSFPVQLSEDGRVLLGRDFFTRRFFVRRLTDTYPIALEAATHAALSRDGRWVALAGQAGRENYVQLIPLAEGVSQRLALPGLSIASYPVFGATPRILLVPVFDEGGRMRSRRFDLDQPGTSREATEDGSVVRACGRDGRMLSLDGGGKSVNIYGADGKRQQQFPWRPGVRLHCWSNDQESIFGWTAAPDLTSGSLEKFSLRTQRWERVRELKPDPSLLGNIGGNVAISGDGRYYSYGFVVADATVCLLRGVE